MIAFKGLEDYLESSRDSLPLPSEAPLPNHIKINEGESTNTPNTHERNTSFTDSASQKPEGNKARSNIDNISQSPNRKLQDKDEASKLL